MDVLVYNSIVRKNKKENKMKKLLVTLMSLLMVLTMTACNSSTPVKTDEPVNTETTEPTNTPSTEPISAENVITYEDYMKAAVDTLVTVEAYVQDHQSWWDGKITVYAQDENGGAYFFYNLACTEEDAAKLVPGTKIRVEGYKGEWAGEIEIMDGRFEIIDSNIYVADPIDVTEKLGTDELINHQNAKVAFNGLTVAASTDPEGNEVAYLYNYDGSGSREDNSDLYFNVSYNGQTYTFVVESYLRGNDSDVYKAVEALKVGDVIDCEGFLYWYEGVNPHITSVTVK